MSKRCLAMALALSILAFLPAGAAAAGTSFAPLKRSIATSHVAADLGRSVDRARSQYRRHRYCASVKTLGRVVERAAKLPDGARVERAARGLQRKVFAKQARRSRCGLARPGFRVAGSLKPALRRLPSLHDGRPRVVARLAGGHGATTDFVQDELVVAGRRAVAAKLAARWHGEILDSASNETHLIRIDARHAPTGDLAADLVAIDPRARGEFKVSSAAGLGLLAVAADAAAHGLKVAPNLVSEGTGVLERSTAEAVPTTPVDGWNRDAYTWWYTGSLGTGDAWRALEIGGRTSNRVKLAVLDSGFSTAGLADLSPASTGADDVPNPGKCSGGSDCPWHGTQVASTAAGIVDNGLGAAGSGGQVTDVTMIHNGHTMFSSIDAIYEALDAGAKLINISSGYELDAALSIFNIPYEDATQTALERGAIVVASAGNDGRDVDAEDCFVVCWEEEWIAPCENDPVICVGGIDGNGRRSAKSNYGREWCGNAQDCDVDIFAPMGVWVGPDGADPNPHWTGGTSFSSPYVAGVLAMILAADPSPSLADARRALLGTADRSADETVSRIVNADGAVLDVNDGRLAPLVKISQADKEVPYGGFNTTTLKATIFSAGPCKCTVQWSSDKDGPMGTGASIDWVYPTAGERTVTVTVKDADGATATDQVKVDATNEPPRIDITKPGDFAHVYTGQPFTVQASVSDPNQPGGLPCASITWDAPDNHGVTGCSPALTLWGQGVITYVQAKVTDADGASGWANLNVIVDKPPLHAPPLVTILSPSGGDTLEPGEVVTLKGAATDPDAGALTGTWSVKYGSTTKVIGQGNTLQWKPSDHVPQGCGNVAATLVFSATDPDGTSTDQVGVKVHYPVC